MGYELLIELLMDYHSDELEQTDTLSPYWSCISELKHTMTHASLVPMQLLEFHGYADGLGEDPDATLGIL